MKNNLLFLILSITIICKISPAQNTDSTNIKLTNFLTKNITLKKGEKMITIYSKSGWSDINTINHIIYKKNKIIRIYEKLSEGMNSKFDSIDTIKLSQQDINLYKKILKSENLNELLQIKPTDLSPKSASCSIHDASTKGIIISDDKKKTHYRQYAIRFYYSKCDINNEEKNRLNKFILLYNLFNINPI